MLHVPYKGVAQAVGDTMSGEVHLTYGVLPAVLPMVTAGRVRALGVTTPKRAPLLPDVPAIGEFVPGYANYGWYSLVAPTGTPQPIIVKASDEVVKAAKQPQFGERLMKLGIDIIGGPRAELDAFRADQTKRIRELAKALDQK